MEDKRLNFGHPLHSTRPPPSYKSDLNSGPLCSPGTVPFGWEKTPGTPKLPAHTDSRDSSFEDCITEEEDAPTTATSTCLEDEDEDEAVVYSDAPEELSRTESFFFNCSLGGISGFEECTDTRPLGIMSCDPKVQDLMMGRFLPAAQAMAAETPTHVGRRQTTRVEETLHVSRVRNVPAQLRYWECRPDLSPNYAPELYGGVETEDEDGVRDRDSSILEDRPMRGCWFLARFCVKAPFRITNGVPTPNLKAAYHIDKVRNASSNEPSNTWLKHKYASPSRSLKGKICDLGWSSSKGSTSPILENPPLATKVPMHCSRPRFSTGGGRTVVSGTDRKMRNDPLPGEKPSTSFRDLLARENKEWNSRSNFPSVEKNPCGGIKDETDYRNHAVIRPIFSVQNPDHSSRQQGKVESSNNRTPARGGGKQENSLGQCSNILLSPPLPRSPSESWLVRTLPFTPSPRRWGVSLASTTFSDHLRPKLGDRVKKALST